MRKENTLHSDVEAHFAYRKRAPSPCPVPLDDDALKHLRSLLVALDDAVVNADAVAYAEVGEIRSEVCGLQLG